jgi:hypothetical protein
MTRTTVQLTTTEMSNPVTIAEFQFGTVPAPVGSFASVVGSVAPGTDCEAVFWFDPGIEVPSGQEVRYNLRFELNVHNSANLQLRLAQGGLGIEVEWRWLAPIGFKGTWSAAIQQAPWFDDAMDYCITIQPRGTAVAVALAERPGTEMQQRAFMPAEDRVDAMLRTLSPQAE